jgi:hypothetical protein
MCQELTLVNDPTSDQINHLRLLLHREVLDTTTSTLGMVVAAQAFSILINVPWPVPATAAVPQVVAVIYGTRIIERIDVEERRG